MRALCTSILPAAYASVVDIVTIAAAAEIDSNLFMIFPCKMECAWPPPGGCGDTNSRCQGQRTMNRAVDANGAGLLHDGFETCQSDKQRRQEEREKLLQRRWTKGFRDSWSVPPQPGNQTLPVPEIGCP